MSTACSGGVRRVVSSAGFAPSARRVSEDRRSVLAMPRLVRALSADLDNAPVFYLTAFPVVLARPITALLDRDGYPSGTLLTTGRSFTARWVFGGSRDAQARGDRRPRRPDAERALGAPRRRRGARPTGIPRFRAPPPGPGRGDRVAAGVDVDTEDQPAARPTAVSAAVVGAPNGEELLPLVRAALGIGQPRDGLARGLVPLGVRTRQRGHPPQGMDRGQRRPPAGARTCVLRRPGDALAAAGDGDSVQFVGWRADADQLLARRRADGGRGAVRGGRSGS